MLVKWTSCRRIYLEDLPFSNGRQSQTEYAHVCGWLVAQIRVANRDTAQSKTTSLFSTVLVIFEVPKTSRDGDLARLHQSLCFASHTPEALF